jgi:hypothetical protein
MLRHRVQRDDRVVAATAAMESEMCGASIAY